LVANAHWGRDGGGIVAEFPADDCVPGELIRDQGVTQEQVGFASTATSLGKDHPIVATGLSNLAALLCATNRLGEAEPLYRRALAISEASLGKDHPEVARDLNTLVRLLQDNDQLDEAEPLMRRMVAIFLAFERATGHTHPNTEAAMRNYAGLLAVMGKNDVEIQVAIAALDSSA
jgi:tetratricopeptide (TPR) repeat protein